MTQMRTHHLFHFGGCKDCLSVKGMCVVQAQLCTYTTDRLHFWLPISLLYTISYSKGTKDLSPSLFAYYVLKPLEESWLRCTNENPCSRCLCTELSFPTPRTDLQERAPFIQPSARSPCELFLQSKLACLSHNHICIWYRYLLEDIWEHPGNFQRCLGSKQAASIAYLVQKTPDSIGLYFSLSIICPSVCEQRMVHLLGLYHLYHKYVRGIMNVTEIACLAPQNSVLPAFNRDKDFSCDASLLYIVYPRWQYMSSCLLIHYPASLPLQCLPKVAVPVPECCLHRCGETLPIFAA